MKNFLPKLGSKEIGALILSLGLLALGSFIALFFLSWQYVLLINLVILLILFLAKWPTVGLYAMILTYAFTNLQFRLEGYYFPVVDGIAVLLLIAVILKEVLACDFSFKKEKVCKMLPGIVFAGLFWLAGFLSVLGSSDFLFSLKYWLRPMVFFYLAFVLLPFHLITGKKIFKRSIMLLTVGGAIMAVIGFVAVVLKQGPAWFIYRAVPFSVFGFNPIAGNHNAIAEVLVATIPAVIMLFLWQKNYHRKGYLVMLAVFMSVVLFLTFSRSGWLVFLLQLLILLFMKYRRRIDWSKAILFLVLFVVVGSAVYFLVWHGTSWVESSDTNRIMMSEIALHRFFEKPALGHGPGLFQKLIGSAFVYWVEFSDALDSHGFVQKLLAETGLFGLITFLAILFYIGRKFILAYQKTRKEKNKQIILAGFLIFLGVTVFQLFSTSYFTAVMWLPIGICLAGLKYYGKLKF